MSREAPTAAKVGKDGAGSIATEYGLETLKEGDELLTRSDHEEVLEEAVSILHGWILNSVKPVVQGEAEDLKAREINGAEDIAEQLEYTADQVLTEEARGVVQEILADFTGQESEGDQR